MDRLSIRDGKKACEKGWIEGKSHWKENTTFSNRIYLHEMGIDVVRVRSFMQF